MGANGELSGGDLSRRPLAVLADYGFPVLAFVGIVIVWQFVAMTTKLPAWILPSPVNIADTARHWAATLPAHAWITLYESFVGFGIAIAVGIPLSVFIVYSRLLRKTIYPILVALQSVPKVALAPLVLMWMGHGDGWKLTIVFLVCFFPIVVATVSGMDAVPEALVDLARSLSASPLKMFFKIRLPNAMPYIFVGLKVGITMAVTGAVVAEFVAGSDGLGFIIVIASQQLNAALAFTAMILLTVLTLILFYAFAAIERLVIPWASK